MKLIMSANNNFSTILPRHITAKIRLAGDGVPLNAFNGEVFVSYLFSSVSFSRYRNDNYARISKKMKNSSKRLLEKTLTESHYICADRGQLNIVKYSINIDIFKW